MKSNHPSHHSQLFPPSLERLRQSPRFQQQQKALAPPYTTEELQKFRAMLGAPFVEVNADLPPELLQLLREQRGRRVELELEQTLEQQVSAQIERVPEQSVELPLEQSAEPAEPIEQIEPAAEHLAEQRPEQVEQPPEQPSGKVGHPFLEIPYLGEALEALAEETRDPRKRVTTTDIDFVLNYLKNHRPRVVVSTDSPDRRPTIRRRVKRDREARLTGAPIKLRS